MANSLLAPQRLSLGPSGAAAWSYKNRGYGAYRRLLLGSDSIAWLRLELSQDGKLSANLKAHRDDRAEINASAEGAIEGLDAVRAGDLLLACLRPAIGSSTRLQQVRSAEAGAGEPGGQSVDGIVGSALQATNGALMQAGARIVPLAADATLHRYRMTLRVEVSGHEVARMHIARLPHELEVAVGLRDARLVNLGRVRRLPLEGITIHALAELVAGCAWPAIAHFSERRGQA
jgi:hypothetical protein